MGVGPLRAVIFDCDGTLVDSESLANAVLAERLAGFGLALTAEEAVAAFRGRRMAECIAEIEVRLGTQLPESFMPDFRAATAEAFRGRLRAMEGASDLVAGLRMPMAIASNGPRDKIELCLALTGLLPYFEGRIFSAYELDAWKPDPRLFLHAARSLGVDPSACLVVEDSLPGIAGALAAGMRVLAYRAEGASLVPPDGVPVIGHLREVAAFVAAARADA
ncbi:HAD family hydrolase [Arenibaculum pallidiluteum]|uniref:HAD family hydrolase n=1 Tax=Arenibaculum pallidiluteum TaxID=2812559 RepID=UPI001F231AEF|nr:HAD-IA family hydrolase [Arenibaculum pallidiluteum]